MSASTTQSSNVMLFHRVKRELEQLDLDPPPGISVWPIDPEQPLKLAGRITGPPATPFEEGEFEVEIDLPSRYPFEPPKLRFISPIYHPNIDSAGRICLSTLTMPPKGSWTPSLNISTVLTSLRSLLAEPNAQDPLVIEICEVYKNNPAEYERRARDWSRRLACPKAILTTQQLHQNGPAIALLPRESLGTVEKNIEEEIEFELEEEETIVEDAQDPKYWRSPKRRRHD